MIIKTVILFVYQRLPDWRDNPFRTQEISEPELTSDLVTFLSRAAHNEEQNFLFNHEEPQSKKYRIDFAAFPTDKDGDYTKKIVVFECKRLPAPSMDRQHEYVTGYAKKNGGIQRFKQERHGVNHEIASMIGYIQSGTIQDSEKLINICISDLCIQSDTDDLVWIRTEFVKQFEYDCDNSIYHGISTHPRKTKDPITIHHLWIVL
jgi:hypothetical protein